MKMTKESFANLLIGRDLRTIKQNSIVVRSVKDQESFDQLFALVFFHERPLVMKAVDAVEKITRKSPAFLKPHKAQLLAVLESADHKELKWHIAQLLPRLPLTGEELENVRHTFCYWALNRNESKIVRVNALQGLFDLAQKFMEVREDLRKVMAEMEREKIPSIQARTRKLKSLLSKQTRNESAV